MEAASNLSPVEVKISEIRNMIKLNHNQKSLDLVKQFLTNKPNNLDGLILAGEISTKLCDYDNALKYFKTALEVDYNNSTVIANLKILQKKIIGEYESKGSESSSSSLQYYSMDPYPGDDELMILEKDILTNNYLEKIENIVLPNLPIGNAQMAAKHAILSQQYKSIGDYDNALIDVSKSIQIEPWNTSWRVLRAQLYFMRDNLPYTINDLLAIPKKERDQEIWKMGGLVFQQMKLPVLSELWFKCAAKVSSKMDSEAAFLFQTVRVKRLYDPLIPVDAPIQVEFTKYGRAIFATKAIQEEDIIFSDCQIISSTTLSNWKSKFCGNCGRNLMTAEDYFGDKLRDFNDKHLELIAKHWPVKIAVSCTSCDREIYCSDDCRINAWSTFHSVLCPSVVPSAKALYDLCDNDGQMCDPITGEWEHIWSSIYSPFILAKIWANIISSVKKLVNDDNASSPTVLHWAKAKAPYRRFIAFGNVQFKPNMPKVLNLFNTIFTSCYDNIKYPITDEEFQGRFSQATCNLQAYSAGLSPYKLFLSRLTDEDDAFTLLPHLTEKPSDVLLTGLFPLHACLNHSCLNNVEVFDSDCDGKPGVGVRARRDIKSGDELVTTYIDTTLPKKLRRAWLYRSFNFWCECKRCKFEGEDAEKCANCDVQCEDGKLWPACGKCKKAWYCGIVCQKKAWRAGHKDICNAPHSKTCYSET